MNTSTATQANIFRGYMVAAWDGQSADNDHNYDDNACAVAELMGAKVIDTRDTSPSYPGNRVMEYLFPDGSTITVDVIMDEDEPRGIGIDVTE